MSEGSLYSRVSTPEFRKNYEKIFGVKGDEITIEITKSQKAFEKFLSTVFIPGDHHIIYIISKHIYYNIISEEISYNCLYWQKPTDEESKAIRFALSPLR